MEQMAYNVITDRIIAKLESGVIPWKKPWKSARWPRNLVTGIKYRGINVFMLNMAYYTSSKWLTFKQVTALGGTVKRGERATPVVYWNWINSKDEDAKDEERKAFLKYYSVFNLEQCEGLEKYKEEAEENFEGEPSPACKTVVEEYLSREKTLRLEHKLNQAFYNPVEDIVNMPSLGRFSKSEEYSATLFHELVHSTGHASRLDRGLLKPGNSFGSAEYSKEELVAELGSAFLCGHTGIDPITLENSAAYIQGWLEALRKDKKLLVAAGGKAQQAVDYLLNGKTLSEE